MTCLPRFYPMCVNGSITINKLLTLIKEYDITDVDTIMMYQVDHDELALEYHEVYKETKPEPYLIKGVLVREDRIGITQRGVIVIARNDIESFRS